MMPTPKIMPFKHGDRVRSKETKKVGEVVNVRLIGTKTDSRVVYVVREDTSDQKNVTLTLFGEGELERE